MPGLTYIQGSDLPDAAITWLDSDDQVIDYSAGWSFQLKLGNPGSAALITKTSGISGAATAPNVTIEWANTGELNTLDPGSYAGHLRATRSLDSKERYMTFDITITPGMT